MYLSMYIYIYIYIHTHTVIVYIEGDLREEPRVQVRIRPGVDHLEEVQ